VLSNALILLPDLAAQKASSFLALIELKEMALKLGDSSTWFEQKFAANCY